MGQRFAARVVLSPGGRFAASGGLFHPQDGRVLLASSGGRPRPGLGKGHDRGSGRKGAGFHAHVSCPQSPEAGPAPPEPALVLSSRRWTALGLRLPSPASPLLGPARASPRERSRQVRRLAPPAWRAVRTALGCAAEPSGQLGACVLFSYDAFAFPLVPGRVPHTECHVLNVERCSAFLFAVWRDPLVGGVDVRVPPHPQFAA